jgi:flagellar biosynthesis component FlhA
MNSHSASELQPKTLATALGHAAQALVNEGWAPVVVVSSQTARRFLREAVSQYDPSMIILSQQEIVSEVDLQVVGTIDVASRAS